jgi:hypothetical protein
VKYFLVFMVMPRERLKIQLVSSKRREARHSPELFVSDVRESLSD